MSCCHIEVSSSFFLSFSPQTETAILAQNTLQCCHLLLKFVATTKSVTQNYKGVVSVSKAGRKQSEICVHFIVQVCRQYRGKALFITGLIPTCT